jgi:hypothetical protein
MRLLPHNKETVLICPLNWGLGHAARCIPLINELISEGHKVYFTAEDGALALLKTEFPELPSVGLPSFKIRYSHKWMALAMLWQLPEIVRGIVNEHRLLKSVVEQYGITAVISDNRFGLWHKKVKSVYITHQMMIKAPARWIEHLLHLLHLCIINRYNECWIPDTEGDGNLSGDLSHKYPLPRHARFIGWLSRFPVKEQIALNKHYRNLCLISGPEPQRTVFEQMMIDEFTDSSEQTLIVSGKPGETNTHPSTGHIDFVSHLPSPLLQAYILDTPNIICRSGYSTICDLKALKRSALLIPTPGQTEQEYLALLHNRKK